MILMLQNLVSWLGFLISAAGVVVAALYMRRSRWGGLLLLGFAAETAVSLFYRVAPVFLQYGGGMQPLYLVMSLVGLAGSAAIVVAVAGMLRERREGPAAMPPPFIRT